MADMFENLSNHPFLEFYVGDSPEDLRAQLSAIRLPFKVINIYAQGSRHYAWVSLTAPTKKRIKNIK